VKTIHFRSYHIEDMIKILSETEPETTSEIRARHIETAETRFNGPAYSFFHDEELICCAGVTIYWEGCGEIWLATALCWPKYKYTATIWTGMVLNRLQKDNKLRRIQADVVADNETNKRFVEHFGFEAEGLMRKYDVLGRDVIRYARVIE
jgi:RimJ/RimL family protein N-acetyltransferase